MPTQLLPSPPIWVIPMIVPTRSGSIMVTMPWQPIPAPTAAPSGTLVPVLWGHPEQKNGVRLGSSSILRFMPVDGAGCRGRSRAASIRLESRRNSGSTSASASSAPHAGTSAAPSGSVLPVMTGASVTP